MGSQSLIASVRSVLATPPGGAVTLLESKLAVISAGAPSTERFTVGEEEPTACTFIMVGIDSPCSAHRKEGEACSTNVSELPVMVNDFVTNFSSGDVPTLSLTG